MSEYQRARTPEHKQERMEAIMAAGDALFARLPYHEITMGTIAEELGWSRSNLYKYAATKEEIFLELHEAKNRGWLEELADTLTAAMSAADGAGEGDGNSDDAATEGSALTPLPAGNFARIWAEVTDRHGDFLRYQEILFSIIESNVTLERLTEFKRSWAATVGPICAILAAQCNITADEALNLFLRLLFQAPPLRAHFHCADLTREAMRLAGLPPITGTFAHAYAGYTEVCLRAAMK